LSKPTVDQSIRGFADIYEAILSRVGVRGAHLLKNSEKLTEIVRLTLEITLLKEQTAAALTQFDVEQWMQSKGYTIEALVRNVMAAVAALEKLESAA
jgi:hypothetical protein